MYCAIRAQETRGQSWRHLKTASSLRLPLRCSKWASWSSLHSFSSSMLSCSGLWCCSDESLSARSALGCLSVYQCCRLSRPSPLQTRPILNSAHHIVQHRLEDDPHECLPWCLCLGWCTHSKPAEFNQKKKNLCASPSLECLLFLLSTTDLVWCKWCSDRNFFCGGLGLAF